MAVSDEAVTAMSSAFTVMACLNMRPRSVIQPARWKVRSRGPERFTPMKRGA
ncbi:MAG: hypothetical protein U1F43_38675 [Myxococcota bacterium]